MTRSLWWLMLATFSWLYDSSLSFQIRRTHNSSLATKKVLAKLNSGGQC